MIRESDFFFFHSDPDQIIVPDFDVIHVKHLPKEFTKEVIYLDKHKIKGDLSLRSWQIGDRINLLVSMVQN